MNLKLSKNQKKVLSYLLDKYESSKTYKGENIHNQKFSVKPEKIYEQYNDDYADVDIINEFNRDMRFLAEKDLVILQTKNKSSEISSIIMNFEMLPDIYELLERKDITELRNIQIEMYKLYKGIHPIIDAFCNKQIERLSNFKDAEYNEETANNILKLLQYILTNKQEIMERELSVAVLGDTKLFKNSYMTRICKIIELYGFLEINLDGLDAKEKEKIILEEFHVYSNPSYVFFKGDVTINYNDGSILAIKSDNPIAVSSEMFNRIKEVKINVNRIVTVENLTSYHRVSDDNSVFLYLSGYHNTVKQKFLMKIAHDNKDVKWYHFGDIDPDGYYILKNLIERTGILFEPIDMGIEQLEKYSCYCKKLEKNDIVKASSLNDCKFYEEVMQYMLKHNCKLEQEIVSWLENKVI